MATRITQKTVSGLEAPASGNAITYDGEIPGFGVRITSAGAISYILNYRINGRERRYTIGRHPEWSLASARDEAIQLRGQISRGIDPLGQRKEARDAATVNELAKQYLERHANVFKRPKSISDDEYMLDGMIKPRLGTLKVDAVTRRDIEDLHHSLEATPYKANRVLALLSKMFSLAEAWEWRVGTPTKGIQKFPEQKRERWLSEIELKALFSALADYPSQDVANAIRLLVLTGARRGEVLAATWSEFDLKRGVWTKPSHHTKQKKTEYVPLSKQTVAFLKKLKRKGDYLFPARNGEGHLAHIKNAWGEICTTAKLKEVRIHDLRHSFASHLVSSGVPLAMVGKLLGHTQPQTTARYAHLADDPLREATNKFPTLKM